MSESKAVLENGTAPEQSGPAAPGDGRARVGHTAGEAVRTQFCGAGDPRSATPITGQKVRELAGSPKIQNAPIDNQRPAKASFGNLRFLHRLSPVSPVSRQSGFSFADKRCWGTMAKAFRSGLYERCDRGEGIRSECHWAAGGSREHRFRDPK